MAGNVIYHEEQTFGRWWVGVVIGVLAVPVAFIALESLARPVPLVPSLLSIALFVPIAAVFLLARLVVDVTLDDVRVSFHLLWPTRRIRVADIRRAHATQYSPLVDYGGWGVRLSWAGWAFNTGGAEGVLVETENGRPVMIGSRHAKELEAAIGRAIAERPDPT